MRLLQSPHQTAFRTATEDEYPGVGTIRKAGSGPTGEFTLIKIAEAGHSASFLLWCGNRPHCDASGDTHPGELAAAPHGAMATEETILLSGPTVPGVVVKN